MKTCTLALALTAVLTTFANLALADGYPAQPGVNGPSNVSSNANILDGSVNGQLRQDQTQGQQQRNDSHNTAISAPSQGQRQDNVAVGGQGGSFNSASTNRSYTMFGPQANAYRSGDCAGDADGISLYSIFGGIGFSHADESETCRIMGTIQMTCATATSLVQTGAILAQNNQLNAVGLKILGQATDMVQQCVQQMQANPIALQLRAAYGRNIVGTPVSSSDD
ncbi:MAG: hypothetical protein JSS86_21385 [Cyanobacteria bacterium SZAS LIN-2]|nr:hypothetical protein [Cyanobacteria bacterium SZAS LIN-3]MBS1998899.1 hypothetical protein [Cyanobacteria bacterium SZAS LIN-2]